MFTDSVLELIDTFIRGMRYSVASCDFGSVQVVRICESLCIHFKTVSETQTNTPTHTYIHICIYSPSNAKHHSLPTFRTIQFLCSSAAQTTLHSTVTYTDNMSDSPLPPHTQWVLQIDLYHYLSILDPLKKFVTGLQETFTGPDLMIEEIVRQTAVDLERAFEPREKWIADNFIIRVMDVDGEEIMICDLHEDTSRGWVKKARVVAVKEIWRGESQIMGSLYLVSQI